MMNNFDLDNKASELATANTPYQLARRLVQLEEELKQLRAVAATDKLAPVKGNYF